MVKNLKLISFTTADGLSLPGLLYEPAKKTGRVAIYLHGNGSSSVFYSADKINPIAEKLNDRGIAFFPFNNRGAHWMKKLDKKTGTLEDRVVYGMTYELINECVLDIDAAVDYLRKSGFTTFYLIGISTGANKIVVYNYRKKDNPVAKYVLLSGGDDTGLYYELEFKKNRKKFFQTIELCRREIKKGRGRYLVPSRLIQEPPISYLSLLDTIDPDGEYNIFPFNEAMNKLNLSDKRLFKEFKSIGKPTLVIYGQNDEYCYGNVDGCVNILKQECVNSKLFTFKIIPAADHGFSGKEKELADTVANWL